MHQSSPSCTNVHQSAPNGSKLHESAPSCTKLHHVALICTKLHQSAPSCTKLHHVAPICTKLHQSAPICTKLNQIEPNCTKLHQTAPSCTKVQQVAPDCTKLHQTASSCTKLQHVVKKGVCRQHTTFTSCQNAACSNNLFLFLWRLDYALEENVLTDQRWCLPLILNWEVVTRILIFRGHCFWSAWFALWCKSIFLWPLLKCKVLHCG